MCIASVLPATKTARQSAHERIFECITEVPIEVRVDERIESGVEVANPEQHANDHVWCFTGLSANVRCYVPEERKTKLKSNLFTFIFILLAFFPVESQSLFDNLIP